MEDREQYLAVSEQGQELHGGQSIAPIVLQPAVSIEQMMQRREGVLNLLRRVMIKDVDYGQIPGTPRPTLYKPGAEKLAGFFGLRALVDPVKIEERWGTDTAEPFFYYKYRCTVYLGDTTIVTYDGIAHSHEDKYRWRWVPEADVSFHLDKSQLHQKIGAATEFKFAVDKAETAGKYGKPASHWQMFRDAIADGTAKAIRKKTKGGKEWPAWVIDTTVYRIPNPSVEDLPHTISAIAQKRAMVGGVRIATNATDIFSVCDYVGEENGDVVEGEYTEVAGRVDQKMDTRTYHSQQTPAEDTGDLYGPPNQPDDNGGRPWEPDVLRANLLKRTGQLRTQGDEWQVPPEPGRVGALVGKLNGMLGDDDRRYTFLRVVFGNPSSKLLDKAQVQAVLDWLEGSAELEITTAEANRLVNAAVTEQATGELFEEEPNDVG